MTFKSRIQWQSSGKQGDDLMAKDDCGVLRVQRLPDHLVVTGKVGEKNPGSTFCKDRFTPPVRFAYFCSVSGSALTGLAVASTGGGLAFCKQTCLLEITMCKAGFVIVIGCYSPFLEPKGCSIFKTGRHVRRAPMLQVCAVHLHMSCLNARQLL